MTAEVQVAIILIGIAILGILWKICAVVEDISHSLDQSKRLDALEERLDDEGEEWKR